jgi:[histone H3]-lysine36 N-dimethyltransferase SETMAR
VEYRPRSGRPRSLKSVDNISRIYDFIQEEPKSSVRCIADSLNLSKGTVHHILREELLFRKVCSVWVPHQLTDAHKAARIECANSILSIFDEYSEFELMRLFATEDESWICFDSILTKAQNMVWIAPQDPRPTVVREQLTFRKTMLSLVFTGNGKIHADVTEKGETIDSARYIEFAHQAGERWRKLRSDSTCLKELLWMHDNARPHSAAATAEFFSRRGVRMIKQSAYSPDFNFCDRWLFRELKKGLRQQQFDCADGVLKAALQIFRNIPEDRFKYELHNLATHCTSVIMHHGEYVTN